MTRPLSTLPNLLALTLLLPLLFPFIPAVLASGCSLIFGCGVVHNQTPYAMKYTLNPNAALDLAHPKPGDGLCAIWNWSGYFSFHAKTVACTQKTLQPHASVGGRKSKIDVDAYCFADRDYFAEGAVRKKGVWTKIGDGTDVTCSEGGDIPICETE